MKPRKHRAFLPSAVIITAFLLLAGCSANNQPNSSSGGTNNQTPTNQSSPTNQGTNNQTPTNQGTNNQIPTNQGTNNQGTPPNNQAPQNQQQSVSIVGAWKTGNQQIEAEFTTSGAVEIENGTAKYRGSYSLVGNSQVAFSNLMLDTKDSRGSSAPATLPNSTSSYQVTNNTLVIDNLPSVGRCELTWIKNAD